MRLLIASLIVGIAMPMAPAAAGDRVTQSVEMLRSQTAQIVRTIELQNGCIGQLKTASPNYVAVCNAASSAHMESVVIPNMSVYLDTVGTEAAIRRDRRLLNVANDFLFYVEQSRTLFDEINIRLTPQQQKELFAASMAK